MRKKEFLESLKEVYCRIGVTQHGVGLVAIRAIPKGTDPLLHADPFGTVLRIKKEELDMYPCPEEAKALVRDFCALQEGYYHVPSYGMDALTKNYYLNHSKKPNMVTHDKGETFVDLRNIKAGEELTADYDTYHTTEFFKTA